jgi:hypothetical protein
MPDESVANFQAILERFRQGGVEFLVILGQAEVIFGGARQTFDVDLCYPQERRNVASRRRGTQDDQSRRPDPRQGAHPAQ